ncbi:arylamine N-acetyltransferase family protein [Polyangium spumosum]|nr:arylamine N-acetyltransferase [Polyangium spumosum]
MSTTYLPRYLARLGFAGPPRPTLDALADLQRRHLLTFPFENLCLHLPELRAPIRLDHDALVTKIVDGAPGRGGYCFELNTLFARLLVDLGFRMTTGAARVLSHLQPVGADPDRLVLQPLTHMILFVDLDDARYLVDVGFGPRCPMAPIALQHLATVADAAPVLHRLRRGDAGRRAIVLPGEGWYVQVGLPPAPWEDQYFFTEARYFAADYDVLNYYTSTSPDVFSTQCPLWCKPLREGGRIELWGSRFRRYAADETVVDEAKIEGLDALRSVLRDRCGVRVP